MRINFNFVNQNLDNMKEVLSTQGRAVYIVLPNTKDLLCIERKTVEFVGYMETDVMVLEYLEYDVESYTVNNPEYYPSKFIDHVFDALQERINKPFEISSFSVPFESFAIKTITGYETSSYRASE